MSFIYRPTLEPLPAVWTPSGVTLPGLEHIRLLNDRAGDLWAFARQHGHPHGDADLIIAATALESQRVLVTGNSDHFAWIPGLTAR